MKGAGISEAYWYLQLTEYCYRKTTNPEEIYLGREGHRSIAGP